MGGKSSHSSRKIIETVRLKDYFEVEIMGKPLGSFDLMKGKVGGWLNKIFMVIFRGGVTWHFSLFLRLTLVSNAGALPISLFGASNELDKLPKHVLNFFSS